MSTHTRTLAVVVLAVMGVSMSLSVADAQLVIHSWAGPRERHQPTSRWVVRGDDGSESVDRYQSGYDAGHRIGYSEGYVTGMQVGTTDGTDVGTTEGWDDGWVAGYEPAYEQSYATSYPLAHEAGWLERYPEAFQSGYADGYDKYLEDSGGSHLSGGILTWRGVTDLGDIDVIAWDGGFVRLSPQ